jgi:hypothetical protein
MPIMESFATDAVPARFPRSLQILEAQRSQQCHSSTSAVDSHGAFAVEPAR